MNEPEPAPESPLEEQDQHIGIPVKRRARMMKVYGRKSSREIVLDLIAEAETPEDLMNFSVEFGKTKPFLDGRTKRMVERAVEARMKTLRIKSLTL